MSKASLLLPNVTFLGIPYRIESGLFASPPIGVVFHVPMSNGSLFDYFSNRPVGIRKFSHGLIFKDGSVEQYCELSRKAWAAIAGNTNYWHFEVEGFDTEPMTPAQIKTCADIVRFLEVPAQLAEAPGETGIGTHAMGGAAWGAHSCPGVIRAGQRVDIVRVVKGGAVVSPPPVKPPNPLVPAFPGTIRLGSVGAAVVAFQRRFLQRGWRGATVNGFYRPLVVDGIDGVYTTAVVKSFQREKGLTVDGIGGPLTWEAMWTMPTATGKTS